MLHPFHFSLDCINAKAEQNEFQQQQKILKEFHIRLFRMLSSVEEHALQKCLQQAHLIIGTYTKGQL